jgi:hypothetical protein
MKYEFKIVGQHAEIHVNRSDDGDMLISQTSYPLWTTICVPMDVAVLMAKDILEQANSFTGPASDDDWLHMIDESNFPQERE